MEEFLKVLFKHRKGEQVFEAEQVRKDAKLYTFLFYDLPCQDFPTDSYKGFTIRFRGRSCSKLHRYS